jgi:hypothetical protein
MAQQPNTHTCSIDSDTHTSLTTEHRFMGWRINRTQMHVGTVRQWSWGWQLMYLMLVPVPHVPGSSAKYSIIVIHRRDVPNESPQGCFYIHQARLSCSGSTAG